MSSTSFDPTVAKTQYLQLFATQLQHQDPLDPVKQEDFLSQLAQFSSVESLQNMSQQFAGLGTKLDSLIAVTKGSGSANESANADLTALQTLNAGAGLLGKSVRWETSNTDAVSDSSFGASSTGIGVVDQIKPDGGSILVRIGDRFVPIASIVSVADDAGALNM
ncbi:MAG TPA: flagellar hook capping FlgD N-terminal domain-containing protein [Planctomycetaceae bacterium]|nr:flagellar hook capping FlgD N-terminal domain-containing protein [Planctomycetaceae bacterium]HQZ64556.1 flagellar hook capping FlgD N-terminal domain-containing protein [Planctomycetaceae bacterium]